MEFIEFGTSKINFQLIRSERKTLGISVLSDGKVQVTAPISAPLSKIKDHLLLKGTWIMEQMKIIENIPVPSVKKNFVSGESYYFLGNHVRLKVIASDHNEVCILGDRLILHCENADNLETKRNLILNWYELQAKLLLTKRFDHYCELYGCSNMELKIEKLQKVWGKYYPSKKLVLLNLELIVAPIECANYVIIHELSHIKFSNHKPEFFKLLSSRLPNWKRDKILLEQASNGLTSIY